MAVTLGKAKITDMPAVKKLLLSAFPSDERPPFLVFAKKCRLPCCDLLSIYNDKEWAGFFYCITYNEYTYVMFFAVKDELRNRGIGSQALRQLLQIYKGSTLFLAIEPPEEGAENLDERIHRKAFYLRNGFSDMKQKMREGSIIYELLGTGQYLPPQIYDVLIHKWADPIWGKIVKMEVI